jgi:hypothetical protein
VRIEPQEGEDFGFELLREMGPQEAGDLGPLNRSGKKMSRKS